MGAQAKVLRTLGYMSVEHTASQILTQLHNVGFFTGGGVLVGAQRLYLLSLARTCQRKV